MEKLLEMIGNKKLTRSFMEKDVRTFKQIALKLYSRARLNQDKKEYLLSECLKFADNRSIDIESAFREYLEIRCQETALKARGDVQSSSTFITEKDSLKRFDIKESAYQNAYEACINCNK